MKRGCAGRWMSITLVATSPGRSDGRERTAVLSKDGHSLERHGPEVELERGDPASGERTIEGRIFGDDPWGRPQEGSSRWFSYNEMNTVVNDFIRTNWERIRSELAMDGVSMSSSMRDTLSVRVSTTKCSSPLIASRSTQRPASCVSRSG
jgi:hypothetical protein